MLTATFDHDLQRHFASKAAWQRHKKAVLQVHAEQWLHCRPVVVSYEAPKPDFLAEYHAACEGGTAVRRKRKRSMKEARRQKRGQVCGS